MNNIVERENTEENLQRLCAQRELYQQAKRISALDFFLSVVVVIFFSLAKLLCHSQTLINIVAVYSLVIAVVGYIMNGWILSKKNLAARVQNLFDCDVLGLKWNDILYGEKPSREDYFLPQKNGNTEGLRDWYDPLVANLSDGEAQIICQRTNVVYDGKLRKAYKNLLLVMAIAAGVLIIVVACLLDTSLRGLILNILPLLPLVLWAFRQIHGHSSTLDRLKELQNKLDGALESLVDGTKLSSSIVGDIQLLIFQHRKDSLMIPSWFYRCQRPLLEEQTHFAVKGMIDEIHKRNG